MQTDVSRSRNVSAVVSSLIYKQLGGVTEAAHLRANSDAPRPALMPTPSCNLALMPHPHTASYISAPIIPAAPLMPQPGWVPPRPNVAVGTVEVFIAQHSLDERSAGLLRALGPAEQMQ
eukprot:4802945-Prymnesium_polylepis.1